MSQDRVKCHQKKEVKSYKNESIMGGYENSICILLRFSNLQEQVLK